MSSFPLCFDCKKIHTPAEWYFFHNVYVPSPDFCFHCARNEAPPPLLFHSIVQHLHEWGTKRTRTDFLRKYKLCPKDPRLYEGTCYSYHDFFEEKTIEEIEASFQNVEREFIELSSKELHDMVLDCDSSINVSPSSPEPILFDLTGDS